MSMTLWASVSFSDDVHADPSYFHGVFTTREAALQALNVDHHIENGAELMVNEESTSVVFGGDWCVAGVFKIMLGERVSVPV